MDLKSGLMIKRSSLWLEGLYSRGAIYAVVLRICISCGLVNSSEFDFCLFYIPDLMDVLYI